LAFAIQGVLPTSPIYRGPNPTHIEVQICSPWKGGKALHTSQGTWAFALDRNPGPKQLDTLAIRTSSLQQLDTLAIRTRLSGSDARKSSNWTLQLYPHKEFPSNWTLQSYPHKRSCFPVQGICETGRWHAFSFPLHPKGQDFNQFASGLDLKRCQ
jgi:hypothetical protein